MRSSRFERAPRRGNRATPAMRIAMVERLEADPRYRLLKPAAKHVLMVGVFRFADADGKWWPPIEAADSEKLSWAAAAAVSASTVKRAIAAAVDAKLIERKPYLRPDGRQGSTTYFLDQVLVWPESFTQDRQGSPLTQLVDPAGEAAVTSQVTIDPPTSQVIVDPPERIRNGYEASTNLVTVLGEEADARVGQGRAHEGTREPEGDRRRDLTSLPEGTRLQQVDAELGDHLDDRLLAALEAIPDKTVETPWQSLADRQADELRGDALIVEFEALSIPGSYVCLPGHEHDEDEAAPCP